MVHFGQHDHVRVYGRDEMERLAAAGFEVRDVTAADLFDAATVERSSSTLPSTSSSAGSGGRAGRPAVACRAGASLWA